MAVGLAGGEAIAMTRASMAAKRASSACRCGRIKTTNAWGEATALQAALPLYPARQRTLIVSDARLECVSFSSASS